MNTSRGGFRSHERITLREALEKAFDYRGNITFTLKTAEVEGYVFDRRPSTSLAEFNRAKSFPSAINQK